MCLLLKGEPIVPTFCFVVHNSFLVWLWPQLEETVGNFLKGKTELNRLVTVTLTCLFGVCVVFMRQSFNLDLTVLELIMYTSPALNSQRSAGIRGHCGQPLIIFSIGTKSTLERIRTCVLCFLQWVCCLPCWRGTCEHQSKAFWPRSGSTCFCLWVSS